jgi:hypothetical protein
MRNTGVPASWSSFVQNSTNRCAFMLPINRLFVFERGASL